MHTTITNDDVMISPHATARRKPADGLSTATRHETNDTRTAVTMLSVVIGGLS